MLILPDDPTCPNCWANTWSDPSRRTRSRECKTCGHVQHLLTDTEHWLREQAEYDAEIASGA